MFVFIRKNTNIFEKQRHLSIFLEFHKTIMQQLESHQKDIPILSLTILQIDYGHPTISQILHEPLSVSVIVIDRITGEEFFE